MSKTNRLALALLGCLVMVTLALAQNSGQGQPSVNSFPYLGATGYFSPRRPGLPNNFDYIVVGSGPAGSTIASRLSENPNNMVLMLERGSDTGNQGFIDGPPADWSAPPVSVADQFTMIDFHHEPVVSWNEAKSRVSSGFGLGGSSLINSEMFVRGNPYDYDNWVNTYGATGWGYSDVLPFFKKLENNPFKYSIDPDYHSISGPLNVNPCTFQPPEDLLVVAAANAYGIPFNTDHNGPNQLTSPLGSISWHDTTVMNGIRQSAYKSYIKPNLNRPNLWVVDSAHVNKINFDRHNRAVSVTWSDLLNGAVVTSGACKEIVISAGGIHTPKLLQLSGIGNGTALSALGIPVIVDNPNVGQNLMDHPITNLAFLAPTLPYYADQQMTPQAYEEWAVNGTGVYSGIGGRIVTFLRTKYQNETGDPRPDIEVIAGSPGRQIFTAVYLLNEKSRGSVQIKSRNPFVDPLPTGNYFTDPHDTAALCEGLRMLNDIYSLVAPNVTISTGPTDFNSNSACGLYLTGYAPYFIPANSNTGSHWSGTARMGAASDPRSVVDPRLRVIGVTGLRVADASIFPEIPSGNTQAPSYMVGEKAAAMILEDNA